MLRFFLYFCDMDAVIQTKTFTIAGPFPESHSFIKVPAPGEPFAVQVDMVVSALRSIAAEGKVRFVRFFLSDAANQQPLIAELLSDCNFPVSYIQQPPLDGTKIAAWVYSGGPENLVWHAGMTSGTDGSLNQMGAIFDRYGKELESEDLSVAENCIRTWIFVHDVDLNYGGVVKGRRDYFDSIGLVPDTHFIASTGIEGRHADPSRLVTMDAVAYRGLQPSQVQYLYAKDHLSPTADYGVTFERGTAVHLPDRTHVYISGTASIDSKGAVVHVGDVRKQAMRMLENIDALLAEAKAGRKDIAMAILYLRDMADYATVREIIESECPGINVEYVLAPVCRTTWLVEMECIAVL